LRNRCRERYQNIPFQFSEDGYQAANHSEIIAIHFRLGPPLALGTANPVLTHQKTPSSKIDGAFT
jgi:hypothetical protein